MTERVHGVVLVGDGNAATELLAAGINDFVIFDREVVSSVFDDDTETWTLTADDGEILSRPRSGRLRVAIRPVDSGSVRPQGVSRHRDPCGDARRPISTRPAGASP